jgi:hypothetical protein
VESSAVGPALDTLSAEDLRALVRELLPWLDERTQARFANAVIDRAARGGAGWTPERPGDTRVRDILAFAEAATRVGHADASEVDGHLRQGTNAFLAKDYRAAYAIFRALLVPIGEGDIDLGQHEMVDEVLGVDVNACAVQYAVAAYMTAVPVDRANAVRQAIDEVQSIGCFVAPLREMEQAAIEPLPDLDEFLPRWHALIEETAGAQRRGEWEVDADRWLREIVQRLEGAAGLASIARETKRAEDLGAWCRALVEVRDWNAALAAFEEAAEIVADKSYARGTFLDGAALAAQELRHGDLPARLERTWREAPTFARLRRWLGGAGNGATVIKRAAEALDACPQKAHRQRAFLHVLLDDFEAAARLLAAAPGLGWSGQEHPGPLLFPLFQAVLGGNGPALAGAIDPESIGKTNCDDIESMYASPDEPQLATPGIDRILALADAKRPPKPAARTALLGAMRKAAEKRVAGVLAEKRRRYYGHAAKLVLVCAALDSTAETAEWVAGVRHAYRRFPAFQVELARHGNSS